MSSIGGVTAVTDAKPNDAQIADIAYKAGQTDIEAAKLALEKSRNRHMHDFTGNKVRDRPAAGGAG